MAFKYPLIMELTGSSGNLTGKKVICFYNFLNKLFLGTIPAFMSQLMVV